MLRHSAKTVRPVKAVAVTMPANVSAGRNHIAKVKAVANCLINAMGGNVMVANTMAANAAAVLAKVALAAVAMVAAMAAGNGPSNAANPDRQHTGSLLQLSLSILPLT